MTGQREERLIEYRKLLELCEKYQMIDLARELEEQVCLYRKDRQSETGSQKPGHTKEEGLASEEDERILKDFRRRIGSSLMDSLELYYENKRIYDRIFDQFAKKADQGYEKMKSRLLTFMDSRFYDLGRDQALTAIWLRCGNNLTVYGELFSYQIKESGVKDHCEGLIRLYRELLQREVENAIGSVRWYHRADSSVESVQAVEWDDEQLQREGDEVYLADDFLFRLLQTANSYGFGNAVRLLPDARLLQKAIEIGQKALMWYLDSCSDQCNMHLLELYHFYRDSFEAALRAAFCRETGRSPEEIADEILETEKDMTLNGLYGNVPYYPLKKAGGIEFLQSVYYIELAGLHGETADSGNWVRTEGSEPEEKRTEESGADGLSGRILRPSIQELCDWAKTMVFEPWYAERMSEAKSKMYEALFAYNGSAAVKMPLIAQGTENVSDNRDLERICPFFHRISWGKAGAQVQVEYKQQRKDFQEWCALRWNGQCKEREKEAVHKCLIYYQEIFEGEVEHFLNTWKDWRSSVAREPRMQESSRQAALQLDAFTYYQWYYYPVYPGKHTLRFLMEFRQTGKISGYLTRQIRIVDTKGVSMVPELAEKFRILFSDYLVQVAGMR